MKKLLFVCLFVLGASAMSFAQGGPGGGGRPQQTPAMQLERLKTNVTGITADQETKITAIYTASAVRMDSLTKALGDDRSAMREKRQPITAATNAKIKAVLTADQQKQFDAIPARGFGGGAPGGGAPGGGAPGGGAPRN